MVGVARVNPHGAPTPWKIRFQEVVLALRTIEFNEPIRCKMHESADSGKACLELASSLFFPPERKKMRGYVIRFSPFPFARFLERALVSRCSRVESPSI